MLGARQTQILLESPSIPLANKPAYSPQTLPSLLESLGFNFANDPRSRTMAPLNPSETALLTLDLQQGILGMTQAAGGVVDATAKAVDLARAKGYLLLHVGLGFTQGYPELPPASAMPQDSPFVPAVANNMFLQGSPEAQFHPKVYKEGDPVIYKMRFGAFVGNQLELVLRTRGIKNLVLMGVSTSGIVISTVRAAYDMDFKMVVIEDACFDADEEVHRVLCEKVIKRQAEVVKIDEFAKKQA